MSQTPEKNLGQQQIFEEKRDNDNDKEEKRNRDETEIKLKGFELVIQDVFGWLRNRFSEKMAAEDTKFSDGTLKSLREYIIGKNSDLTIPLGGIESIQYALEKIENNRL